jgi:hypothetical protein
VAEGADRGRRFVSAVVRRRAPSDAQAAIRGDWTIAYRKYIGPLGEYRSNGLG